MNTQTALFESQNTADFSPCRIYRYTLWRVWGDKSNYVQFIGLNPSTADETTDDATIRRCRNFAKSWGYGAFCMTNLFAFRATDPKVMKAAEFPVGNHNDEWLYKIARDAKLIVAAWGSHGSYLGRDTEIKKLFPNRLFCFGLTKENQPLHPCRLRSDLMPIVYQ
jgi:hypothetical protein